MRHSQFTIAAVLACAPSVPLHADFTYQETTRTTGGSMLSTMKMAGAFSKTARQATEPTQQTVAFQGNRMVRKSANSMTLIDLDKETITAVDYDRKTYSVITFAQMKEMMERISQKTQKSGPSEMQFDYKVTDTGNQKTVNGMNTREVVMSVTAKATDAQSGAQGGLNVVTDSWLAPNIKGYQEVRDFYTRMVAKMDWAPGSNPLLANRPDVARAMARMQSEGAKAEGMPMLQITKIGGQMAGMPAASDSKSSSQSSPPPTSISGALGGMMAGRMRKKQADDAAQNGSSSDSLLETTMEVNSFSTAAADPSLFEVPAGFEQVEHKINGR